MSAVPTSLHLTSGRLLARNTIWNVAGQLLPMAVGVVAVPPLVAGLGVARFGILSLAWTFIGYFNLFDLGIGRALTKLVADRLGSHREAEIPHLVWTASFMMLLLGVAASVITVAASPRLIHILKIPPDLQVETLHGLYWLAASIPLVTITSGLRGVLEAQQRFSVLTLIRVPMVVFSFVGPLMVLPFSKRLVPVIVVLIVGRIAACAAHLLACVRAIPALRHDYSLEWSVINPILRFGGWMTVANLVGPTMVYMDRFLVSSMLSVTMLAYYTAPFDVVVRLTFIPVGVVGVLFPAFAVSLAQDRERTSLLLSRSIKYMLLLFFPIALTIVTLAPEGLRLWLGPAFAQNGATVSRWLALGVLVNGLAGVPFILIQSAGRPDITAKVYLLELLPYLLAVWWLTKKLGIQGTAIAWTLRATADTVLFFVFSGRLLPHTPRFVMRLVATMVAVVSLLGFALIPESLPAKVTFLAVVMAIFAVVAWRWALGPAERVFLIRALSVAPVLSRDEQLPC